MTPDAGKAVARRIADELLTQGDLTVADAILAPNLVYHGGRCFTLGVTGVKRFTRILRQAMPDVSVIIEDELAEGDRVAQRLTVSGTRRSASRSALSAGARTTWQMIVVLRLDPNGRIVESWSSPDIIDVLHQLDAQPAAALVPHGGAHEEDSA